MVKKVRRAGCETVKQITGHKSPCTFHQRRGKHGEIPGPQDKKELVVEETCGV